MILENLKKYYRYIDEQSGRRIGILIRALQTFSQARAPQAAASLAYYAFFSLFPLLLVLIAGGSYFLNRQEVFQSLTQFMQDAIPVSTELINENLRQVLDARGTVGIIGLLTLLWSASGVFTNLVFNINLAWTDAPRRNFLEKRLAGLGMIAGLFGLLILSLSLEGITNLAPFLQIGDLSSSNLGLWRFFSNFGSWLTIFVLFLALYRWVPTANVSWSAAVLAAFVASISWKLATTGFRWYLTSGLGRYQLVYGSLGAIVALLFLIFIVSMITIFGAHLSAAIDQWKNENAILEK